MSVALEFDGLSGEYTQKISRWLPYYQPMLEGVVRCLPASFSPKKTLDMGCGNGNLTQLILQAYPSTSMVLLDASSEMLTVCKDRFESQAIDQFQQAYFQDADLPEDTFDLVTAAFAIHHLEGKEKQAVFQKIYRSLNPGGYLSMTDLYVNKKEEPEHGKIIEKWRVEAKALGTSPSEWQWIMDHYDAYDRPDNFEDQVRWLKEAGFTKVEITWKKDAWGCLLARK